MCPELLISLRCRSMLLTAALLLVNPSNVRRENLNHAGKLSRTFATLLEALNRHRGKGQQNVVVEHVHVYKGGQAIVGNVGAPGGGFPSELEAQSHAKQIAYASQPPMRGSNTRQEPVPIP